MAHNGVDTWELPIPAIYVVAKSGKIVSAYALFGTQVAAIAELL